MIPARFKMEALSLFRQYITAELTGHGSHPGLQALRSHLVPADISVFVYWNVHQDMLVPTNVDHLSESKFADLTKAVLGCPIGSFWVDYKRQDVLQHVRCAKSGGEVRASTGGMATMLLSGLVSWGGLRIWRKHREVVACAL